MHVKIGDVAKAAGVSVATVSRVLNDSASVRPDTRERVLRTMEQLSYNPNLLGRNLRKRETRVILVFLSTIVNTFYSKVVRSIESVAHEHGYTVLICATYDDPLREREFWRMLQTKLADGAVILSSLLPAEELKLRTIGLNIVFCCEHFPDLPFAYVAIDDEQAGYDVTAHLIKTSRKRILFLAGDPKYPSTHFRLAGYRRALSDHNLPDDDDLLWYGNYGYGNARTLISQALDQGLSFDAVEASCDRAAAGSIAALTERGYAVPGQISVTGFDHTELSRLLTPALTTVSQSRNLMGKTAAELLLRSLKGESIPAEMLVPHGLIIRQSSDR